MPEFEPRPLHLHTLDSLVNDLVSGRPIVVGADEHFALSNDRARSALNWYRLQGEAKWASNVSSAHGEALVSAITEAPPELPVRSPREAGAGVRKLTLHKIQAHRFAGVHKFGTLEDPPPDFVHEFGKPVTLLEGSNGSGKTSLVNAVIWALTGELLRPQRPPESARMEFSCSLEAPDSGQNTDHKLSPVTPLPDATSYRPTDGFIPIDTWVELTFVDEEGKLLPPIRRRYSRNSSNKLVEAEPDLSILNVDPIALRIGTVMPGLLSHIQIGDSSELSEGVSQLTGLSSLEDLAGHAGRARKNIGGDYSKGKEQARERADCDYLETRTEIGKILEEHPGLSPPIPIPPASDDKSIEEALETIVTHFENAKAAAFNSARHILGEAFDPADVAQAAELARCCPLAIDRVGAPQQLPSFERLAKLRKLSAQAVDAAESKIARIIEEGRQLGELAANPDLAARERLYARVAAWIAEHPDSHGDEARCAVCGGSLGTSVDPVTGKPVHVHLKAVAESADLISLTLARWAENAEGDLMRGLDSNLALELATDPPAHPCDLMRKAVVDELFGLEAFKGVLSALREGVGQAFDDAVANRRDLAPALELALPAGCESLRAKLQRLDHAIRFVHWRQDNDALAARIREKVIGRFDKDGEGPDEGSLASRLTNLLDVVQGARPISEILEKCGTLQKRLGERRAAEKRLAEYAGAAEALGELVALGDLARRQVNQLQEMLRDKASTWRDAIYSGAFPESVHKLADTSTGQKGELHISISKGGYSAPAQHVANASALRASLTGFYLAFWEHVLNMRGGLKLMILDDPQDLLDENNRENLAEAVGMLAKAGAQPIVTSYDARFSRHVSRLKSVEVDHYAVHPCTVRQPRLRLTQSVGTIIDRKEAYAENVDDPVAARDYANHCRIFLETKLGNIFDDPAHSAWSASNPHPTLATFVQRLRPLVKQNPQGMFGGGSFRRFIDHPALADESRTIRLMNKAHHGQWEEITASEVHRCANELHDLVDLVEEMHDEAYRWRRREALGANDNEPISLPSLTRIRPPAIDAPVCLDLAAFTGGSGQGGSQDVADKLDVSVFEDKALFYLRRHNFGFAAPQGSLAVVEALPSPVGDRRLVIARDGTSIYARRLLRSRDRRDIGLAAEVLDPRHKNPQTVFLPESRVELHRVVGIIFDHGITEGPGPEEAIEIDAAGVLERVEMAFRVADDSAVPLALSGQMVLGGPNIHLTDLREGSLVALMLTDGASIFKRIGKRLPGDLGHLRQFESIGGLGSSEVLAVGKEHPGFRQVSDARLVVGVMYNA